MKIQISDTFTKSIKRLAWQESKTYKAYSFFRYDIPGFFKNIWHFRKPLWNFRWWDYRFTLEMFQACFKIMSPRFEKLGLEIDETRMLKVNKMNRAIEILQNFLDDTFIEEAEKELGELIIRDWEFEPVEDKDGYFQLKDNDTEEERTHNRKVFDRARDIEDEKWEELWNIMRGTDRSEWSKYVRGVRRDSKEEAEKKDFQKEIYDGTDLRGWWD
jgi:hypothetical protein